MLGPIFEEQALFQNTCLHVRGSELHRRAVMRVRHRARAECEAELLVVELHLGRVQLGSRSSMCELSQCAMESKDSIEFLVATFTKVRQQ